MNLTDVIDRALPPTPWEEGDNIPWNDPAFSERMLAAHLRQDSDCATRKCRPLEPHAATRSYS